MKFTVYLDLLLVTNIIINYFLLKISAVLCGLNTNTKRMLLSSFAGTLFSLTIFVDISFIQSLIVKTVSVFICAAIVTGMTNRVLFLRFFICMWMSTFIFTGLITALFFDSHMVITRNMNIYLNINPLLLVGCILSVYIILFCLEFVLDNSKKEYTYNIDIYYKGNVITGTAFYDTGFKVKDVVTFRTVMMCSFSYIHKILPENILDAVNSFYEKGVYNEKGIIPVFYSDLNNSGIMPAIIPDSVVLNSKNTFINAKDAIVAISKNKISEDYDVIFGRDIYNLAGENND